MKNQFTKSDLLLYLEAPLHLWAKRHNQLDKLTPSRFEMHLVEQGYQVEDLAEEFIAILASGNEIQRQLTVVDGVFEARSDFVVKDEAAGVYDLYEVKSSTSEKKEHIYDLAFQMLVFSAKLPMRDYYLVLVEKEYQLQGDVDPSELFKRVLLNNKMEAIRDEVLALRQQAWLAIQKEESAGLSGCNHPDSCPCPSQCHPNLPSHSIYDLPRLGKKADELKAMGVVAINEIPMDCPLSDTQRSYVDVVINGQAKIDIPGIRKLLAQLAYPLYFLDYETINPAVPLFDGYHPFDLVVFQYSLHVIEAPGKKLQHYECLLLKDEDPAPKLASELSKVVEPQGSVLVWNKTFETRCNVAMAQQAAEYAPFLEGINARLFDLMNFFNKRLYMHPNFHGSASIKKVLPVLVPELSYDSLDIQDGTQAMVTWRELVYGNLTPTEFEAKEAALRKYCELDTLAMVEVWRVLDALTNS